MGFFSSQKSRDKRENDALYERAYALWKDHVPADFDPKREAELRAYAFLTERGFLDGEPYSRLANTLFEVLSYVGEDLLKNSSYFLTPQNPNDFAHDLSRMYEERAALRQAMTHWQSAGSADATYNALEDLYWTLLSFFPENLPEEDAAEPSTSLSVPLIDACDDLHEKMRELLALFISRQATETNFFPAIHATLKANIERTSREFKRPDEWLVPADIAKKATDAEIVSHYFGSTALAPVFSATIPFSVSLKVRAEHTHVVGGSGHGKTQLLQHMMLSDLERAGQGGGGFCVIDSQGDMIETLSHLKIFAPGSPLADKLLIVDPNDLDQPPALNMFDIGLERFSGYSALEREKILNGSIELYSYIFGALLGAELTAKQSVIFTFLARYMITTPGATIHTLREFVQHGTPDMDFSRVDPLTQDFFRSQFFTKTYADTRHQVATRLWGVLANSIFERMFSAPANKLNLFSAMNEGKIVLINTAKDLLKSEGCSIFGRFFIAMIAQAALSRAVLPRESRTPFMVYIDEAQDYFDDNIENLLNQSRKYNVGLLFAHQNLGQLSQTLRASIMASTASKFCGGVSAYDARAFAKEMRCESDFILSQKKTSTHTQFATYIKNVTPVPVSSSVPFGAMEGMERMNDTDYEAMRQRNAQALGFVYEEVSDTEGLDAETGTGSVSAATQSPTVDVMDDEDNRYSVDIGGAL